MQPVKRHEPDPLIENHNFNMETVKRFEMNQLYWIYIKYYYRSVDIFNDVDMYQHDKIVCHEYNQISLV